MSNRDRTALAAAAPMPWATERQRWNALRRRDARADGQFFYAVTTTGVFCRPSCGARQPKRENVRFYRSAGEAVASGYRPCLRCKPTQLPAVDRLGQLVVEACRRIADSESPPSLSDLAKAAQLSVAHFHRTFKAFTGLSPKAYALAARSERMRERLGRSGSVTSALYEAGYGSSSRFYASAVRRLGMKPGRFRAGAPGITIRYASRTCSLGALLVAASDVGICWISLGADPASMVEDLRRQFSQANLRPEGASLGKLVARVVAQVERPQLGCQLPLDIQGTAFQERVWRELTQIPVGSTRSYAEVARRLGQPKAARAVAHACAANTLAVVIPCHRVIRGDGGLSGYRWGEERKKRLLARERAKRLPRTP